MADKNPHPPAQRLLCVGEISSAHGARGEVKIKSFTADPAALATYAPITDEAGERVFALRLRSQKESMVIASIKGVSDRNTAEKLRGTKLFAPRAALPKAEKGRFYVEDLKGLQAVDADGKLCGEVQDVLNFGAGDILVIENKDGREWLLPFKPPFAATPDMKQGCVGVAIPEDFPFSEKKKAKPARGKPKQKKK